MASSLPLLAEASPSEFLQAVRDGLSADEPLLAGMFRDQECDPLRHGSCPAFWWKWGVTLGELAAAYAAGGAGVTSAVMVVTGFMDTSMK